MKTKCKAFTLLALATLINKSAFAQASSSVQASEEAFLFYVITGVLIFIILAVLAVAFYILQVMKLILFKDAVQPEHAPVTESLWSRIRKRFITEIWCL
jgi:heme/copper-type cytochrome/quinol oxidase subunit 2